MGVEPVRGERNLQPVERSRFTAGRDPEEPLDLAASMLATESGVRMLWSAEASFLSVSLSLDVSLLSPDSSYICRSPADGSRPCSCRRSPRLLTNGYYGVTQDSFSWDRHGNVSLTPGPTNVSYKETLVR